MPAAIAVLLFLVSVHMVVYAAAGRLRVLQRVGTALLALGGITLVLTVWMTAFPEERAPTLYVGFALFFLGGALQMLDDLLAAVRWLRARRRGRVGS